MEQNQFARDSGSDKDANGERLSPNLVDLPGQLRDAADRAERLRDEAERLRDAARKTGQLGRVTYSAVPGLGIPRRVLEYVSDDELAEKEAEREFELFTALAKARAQVGDMEGAKVAQQEAERRSAKAKRTSVSGAERKAGPTVAVTGEIADESNLVRDPSPYQFAGNENFWHLAFEGKRAQLPTRKGFRRIQMLLERPNHSVSAESLLARLPLSTPDIAIDRPALADLKRRIFKCRSVIETEEDPAAVAEAREELEGLEKYRNSSVGLHGRPRQINDDRKRAASSAGKSMLEAIRAIEGDLPKLSEHLRESIIRLNGTDPVYRPTTTVPWDFQLQK
jgi:hypothetical protein